MTTIDRSNPTRARFWTMLPDGWARLSLRDGESLSHRVGGPTDEGHCWTTTVYSRDGSTIQIDENTYSRDCDGSHLSDWSGTCEISDLESHNPSFGPGEGQRVPRWETLDSCSRDFAAEGANY